MTAQYEEHDAKRRLGLSWLTDARERAYALLPEGQLGAHEEILRALAVRLLDVAVAVQELVRLGCWREAMTLSRTAFEGMVTAGLIAYKGQFHVQFRSHLETVRETLREACDPCSTAEPQSTRHWYPGGLTAMVRDLSKYEPDVANGRRAPYMLGCSFSHCDAFSLLDHDADIFSGIACSSTAGSLYYLAIFEDKAWHGGKHRGEIEWAQGALNRGESAGPAS